TLIVYAGVLLLGAACVWFALRTATTPMTDITYLGLLVSLLKLALKDSVLVLSSVGHGLTFAAFNALWSIMASHLMLIENPWTPAQAGMVNIVGLGASGLAIS